MKKGNTLVVGFCGAKGHGKDTAAEILIERLGFKRVSFADGLRRTVCTALRVNEQYFLDPLKKEEIDPRTGKARRFWLQFIGTEGFRALWTDIWTWWWEQEIKERGYTRIVTTDVRFPNEYATLCKQPNYIMIRVCNPRVKAGEDSHASEAHYSTFSVDHEIINDGTIAELQSKILAIVEPLLYTQEIPHNMKEAK